MEGREEKQKHQNCNKIEELEKRKNYAQTLPLYTSGNGFKRKFGNSMWSNDGVKEFEEIKATWTIKAARMGDS